MSKITLLDALEQIGQSDRTFNPEIRKTLAPVKDQFFAPPVRNDSVERKDGLHTAPPFLTEPDLRNVAIQLAELALDRGIDVNLPWEEDGNTLLHIFALLRDSSIAVENVEWLLAHGADPHRKRDDGETPLSLAVKFGRDEVAEAMRAQGSSA